VCVCVCVCVRVCVCEISLSLSLSLHHSSYVCMFFFSNALKLTLTYIHIHTYTLENTHTHVLFHPSHALFSRFSLSLSQEMLKQLQKAKAIDECDTPRAVMPVGSGIILSSPRKSTEKSPARPPLPPPKLSLEEQCRLHDGCLLLCVCVCVCVCFRVYLSVCMCVCFFVLCVLLFLTHKLYVCTLLFVLFFWVLLNSLNFLPPSVHPASPTAKKVTNHRMSISFRKKKAKQSVRVSVDVRTFLVTTSPPLSLSLSLSF
jgi:hypothetical protein